MYTKVESKYNLAFSTTASRLVDLGVDMLLTCGIFHFKVT